LLQEHSCKTVSCYIFSVIIISYLEFSFPFKFAQFSIIIILGITKKVIIIVFVDKENICYFLLPLFAKDLSEVKGKIVTTLSYYTNSTTQ
jgi:hypothetical protein